MQKLYSSIIFKKKLWAIKSRVRKSLKISHFFEAFIRWYFKLSSYSILAYLYDWHIQKAITKERNPIFIENCSFWT